MPAAASYALITKKYQGQSMDGIKLVVAGRSVASEIQDPQKRENFMRVVNELATDLARSQLSLAGITQENVDYENKIKALEEEIVKLKQDCMNEVKVNRLQRFLLGVEIIRSYEIDANMEISNGFIQVGSYDTCYKLMPQEKRDRMKSWGWVQGYDSWAFHVDISDC